MINKEVKDALDQQAMALGCLAVCIAQTLHESDPNFLARMKSHVVDWHGILENRGDHEAALQLAQFSRALHDRDLFPTRDS